MKVLLIILALHCCLQTGFCQGKYFTKAGKISFYSRAPLEDIEAHNTKAVSVFDASTGQIEFSVLLKGFEFEKAKMQEHFNENYVESDKYPKAVFTGTISMPRSINLALDGVHTIEVNGSLTLHGVTKPQRSEAVFTIRNGVVSASSVFLISLADYNIKIPALVAEKISKTVKIIVTVPSYQPLGAKS